jgi:hypothetical protein
VRSYLHHPHPQRRQRLHLPLVVDVNNTASTARHHWRGINLMPASPESRARIDPTSNCSNLRSANRSCFDACITDCTTRFNRCPITGCPIADCPITAQSLRHECTVAARSLLDEAQALPDHC